MTSRVSRVMKLDNYPVSLERLEPIPNTAEEVGRAWTAHICILFYVPLCPLSSCDLWQDRELPVLRPEVVDVNNMLQAGGAEAAQ